MKLKFRESSVSILSQNDHYCARLQKIDSADLFLLFCVLRLPGRARRGGVSFWLRMGRKLRSGQLRTWEVATAQEYTKRILHRGTQQQRHQKNFYSSESKKIFKQAEKVFTILVTKVRKMFWFLVLYKQREILNHSPSLKRGRINTFVFVFCLLIVTTIILQLCCDNKRPQGQIKPHINTNPCHKAKYLCKSVRNSKQDIAHR